MDLIRNTIISALISALLITSVGVQHGVTQNTLVFDKNMRASVLTPIEYHRPFDQTFLTFPEWYLVHSPREFAKFIENHPPSDFPFFAHIMQFWQSYYKITKTANETGSFNAGYHLMIMVIGMSTTAEYLLRGLYELVVGKATAAILFRVEEDVFAAKAAQDYVHFIEIEPWYKFDFYSRLIGVWRDTRFFDKGMIRKLERKYVLTTDFLIKWLYAKLIMLATNSIYDTPISTTSILLDRLPAKLPTALSDLHVVKTDLSGAVLITVPRYQAFTDYALSLAKSGAKFYEIAGNRTIILFSALLPAKNSLRYGTYSVLFQQEMITEPEWVRVALLGPVADLANALLHVEESGGRIEHVYDY